MNSQKDPVIQVKDLTRTFDGFTAVDAVNFQVHKGEIFGFLGPNGSGKTTTIRMMLGLLHPTHGSIHMFGVPVRRKNQEIQPRVGYMSQHFSLYNDLTVLQNLKFYGKSYGLNNTLLKERIQDALAMADLEGHEKTVTKDLSGGWRQRLALSAAILHRPDILFLDEPTAGIDPVSRRDFWDMLYTFVEQGITVFITTHYMDEAEHCHRLAFLQRGKIIARGSPLQIRTNIMEGGVLEVETSHAPDTIKALKSAIQEGKFELDDIQLYGSLVHISDPEIHKKKSHIRTLIENRDVEIKSMQIIEPSLEDVFIACMRDEDGGEE